MTEKRFYDLVDRRTDLIKHVLIEKGKEYSTREDKLHNFNRGAEMSQQTREKVLLGFLLKHQISLLDIVDDIGKGVLPSENLIDEKIGDIINYYILLEASIIHRLETEGKV